MSTPPLALVPASMLLILGCSAPASRRAAPLVVELPVAAPVASADPAPEDEEPAPKPEAPRATEGDFTCSMHPQVVRAQAGPCPICGMDLVVLFR